MEYSKPKVTIDLEEYLDLKAQNVPKTKLTDVTLNQKSLSTCVNKLLAAYRGTMLIDDRFLLNLESETGIKVTVSPIEGFRFIQVSEPRNQ